MTNCILPLFLFPVVVAVTPSTTPSTTPSSTPFVGAWVALITAFLYVTMVFYFWPFIRFRTGVPIFFLMLIILFPPSFLTLLFYLMLLRLGLLTAAWFVIATEVPVVEVTNVA